MFGLTTFAGNILTMLAIAAATDYGIFIFGRYREARGAGVGSGRRLLHHFSVRRSRHRGFGPDDRRGDVLPELSRGCPTSAPWAHPSRSECSWSWRPRSRWDRPFSSSAAVSGCSKPNGAAQGRLWRRVGTAVVRWPAPDSGGELVRGADRHRRLARIQDRPTTIATICPPTPRSISASPPPTGISRRPG